MAVAQFRRRMDTIDDQDKRSQPAGSSKVPAESVRHSHPLSGGCSTWNGGEAAGTSVPRPRRKQVLRGAISHPGTGCTRRGSRPGNPWRSSHGDIGSLGEYRADDFGPPGEVLEATEDRSVGGLFHVEHPS
jgi:hypothetical protein